ncbi:MAG: B12-binding domain-containing radical SAM protein [Desulfococcaceae bacterium]
MVDILLIQPPVQDFYLTAKRTLPYGLACIASALRQCGFSVGILDGLAVSKSRPMAYPKEMDYLKAYYGRPDISPFALFHDFRRFGYSFEHIGKTVRASGPFIVGISSLFTAYSDMALETARTVKAFHPKCITVLGGHHPSALPKAVLRHSAVDFIIRGEGEAGMPQLAEALRDGQNPAEVPGIGFRRPDGSCHLNPPAVMDSLSDYPPPALDLMPHHYYRRKKTGGSAVIVSSRGCPMKCTYCSVGAFGLPYRRRKIDAVIGEIREGVDRWQARFIDFEDENLSLDRDWFLRLLHEITNRFGELNLELRAMNGLFAPSLDETVIRAMKRAGFRTLNLSLGTMSAVRLKRFRRPDVRAAVDAAIGSAHKEGLKTVSYIIVGAPGQTAEESVRDLLYLAARPTLAGVSVYYPAPGSIDFEAATRSGLLPDHFALMRSTALPISDTTSRLESATLLRLGRILNFLKSINCKNEVESSCSRHAKIDFAHARERIGRRLLRAFFKTGEIQGMTPEGEIYSHRVSGSVSNRFRSGLNEIQAFKENKIDDADLNF